MNYYNFISNMKADSKLKFLKKVKFETLEYENCFYYDYIDKLKENNNRLNIRCKNIAIIQKLTDSYIDECAYTGDDESFENVTGSINNVLRRDSRNIYARNKAGFLYLTRYIYNFDNIYYDIALDHINYIIQYNNDISYFILALLYQFRYMHIKDNQYFSKSLECYKKISNIFKDDININYNVYMLYKTKYTNIDKEKYFDIAAEVYLEILDFNKENTFALCELAKLYRDKFLSSKNYDYYLEAVNYYIELSYIGRDINVLLNLGFLYTMMFKYSNDIHFFDDAVYTYKKIEESESLKDTSILYNLFGYAYAVKYDLTESREDFAFAMNYYDSSYFKAYLYLSAYSKTKDDLYFDASLSFFNHLDIDETDVLNSIAYLYEIRFSLNKDKEDFDNALYYYNRALAIDSDYLYTYVNRFYLYKLAYYIFENSDYFTLVLNDYETLFNEGELINNKLLYDYMNYNIGCFYYSLYEDSLRDEYLFSKYSLKDEFFDKALFFFSHTNYNLAISNLYRLKYIDEHNNKYFDLSLEYINNNFKYDIKNFSQRAILYYERYKIERNSKYFDASLEDFNYALNINNYDKTLYYNSALLYHIKLIENKFDNYKDAEENYLKAIELDNSYSKAIENLGFLYLIIYSIYNINGIFNNSLSCYENILYYDSDSIIALEALGYLYYLKSSNINIDNDERYDYIMKSIYYYEHALSFGIGIDSIYEKFKDSYIVLFNYYSDRVSIDEYFERYVNILKYDRSLANKNLFILNNVKYDMDKNVKHLIKAGKCLNSLKMDIFSIRLCYRFFKFLFETTKKVKYGLLAVFYLEYITNIEKNNADYHFDLGILYHRLYLKTKNYEYVISAFHCYSRVLDINSSYPKCNYNRALMLKYLFEKTLKIDYIENAFENLVHSVKLGNVEAYSLIADVYILLYNKHEKKEEYLNRAIDNYNLSIKNNFYGRNNYEVYFGLGLCYYLKYKIHKEIEDYFNKSLEYYKYALNVNKYNRKVRRFIRYLYIVKKIIPPSS